MKRSTTFFVVLAGLFVVSSATAYLLLRQPAPVVLPSSAFNERTIMAIVVDMDQVDGQARDTMKQTIADFAESFGSLMGGEAAISPEDFSKINEGIDRFFSAIANQKIQAFAVTMEMDFNELIRNGGEGPMPEPTMAVLLKAGKEPDMVALASGIMGEEVPAEAAEGMASEIAFKPLAGGWYAIDADAPAEMLRVPSGNGDAAVAAKFNKALAHSSGGVLQAAFVIPEDAANAMAGKMAADMPEDAPEAIREAVRTISEMQSISYALDFNKGIGIRYYVVFDNADAAERMLDAYGAMMADLPAMMEAANAVSPVPEQDKEMIQAMQERMADMVDLMQINREGETIEIEIDEESFDKMLEMMTDVIQSSLPDA
ncbi:MAG: hypothetical protein KTR15_13020 [Phycisphaeraceae bacterium]|nr:hypothetical protein [Phycisphaeraceae bacterium]